ncbi:MAG: flagellin, partial [Bermanella sp.]
MPQIINTNIASLTAQRNLNKSQSANQQALERLSSGLRINSAKDDAAGLAISTRFNSQIRGLNVAIRNAGDGISLAQTAEGALGTMNDNLQRIRELAVQSANATNSDVDREALQAEVDQLLAEVTRTAEETDFNGRKLLDGSFNATFQIGANAGQTVEVSIAELTAEKLGAGEEAGVSALGTDSAIANGDLVINGTGIRASSATDDTASTNGADRSAISKAAAINESTSVTGVAAEINANQAAGTGMVAASTDGSITLNGISIDIATGGVDTAADRASVIQAINSASSQTGVTATDTGQDSSGITLIADDGRNIELRYDKFDSSGDAYTSGVTAEATGLSSGGGSGAGTATAAVIYGAASTAAFGATLGGTFNIEIDGEEAITVTLTGTGASISTTVSSLQSAIDTAITANGLSVGVTVASNNGVLSLTSDTTGTDSSLKITTVSSGAAAANLSFAEMFGLTQVVSVGLAESSAESIYFESTGSDGIDNTQGTAVGSVGLLRNDGAARTTGSTTTTGVVTFSIEVDGGNAVAISVAGELAAITTAAASLSAYAAKVEAAINSALSTDSQTGTVAVSIDDGFRLVITSGEEGSDSSVRISATGTNAESALGITANTLGAFRNDGYEGGAGVDNASAVYEGSITLRSVNGDDVVVTSGSGSLDSTGLESGTFTAGQAFATNQSQSVSGAVATSGEVVGRRTSSGGLDDAMITALTTVTTGFTISVDGGNNVTIAYTQTAAAATELDSLAAFLTGLESEINSALVSDGQTGSVSLTTNSDNQLVLSSNSKGTSSSIELSGITTSAVPASAIDILGLRNNLDGFGSTGLTDTQGTVTGIGTVLAENSGGVGATYSTALLAALGVVAAETLRVSIDGGKTIDVSIGVTTVGDATAALAYVEQTINDALTAAGQSGQVSLATNTDGYVTIASDKTGAGSSVEIVTSNVGTANSFSRLAGIIDYQKGSVAVSTVTAPDGLDSGDLVINGVAISSAKASDDSASNTEALSSSKQASGIATAAAINAVSDNTGVVATVNATQLSGGAQTATLTTDTPQQGSIFINGFETSTLTTNGANGGADDRSAAISAINAITGQTGVTAIDDGEGITLQAADGRNISVVINSNDKAATESSGSFDALTGSAIGLNIAAADISGGATFAATAQTAYSTVTLDGPGKIDIQAGANGAAALEALGFRSGEYGSSVAGTRISDLDISTVAGAEAAIKALDNAIGSVASQRATLGAVQNRLDSTVNNLSVTSNNLSAANSRIQDADFAAETAELSRTQVLQQAG